MVNEALRIEGLGIRFQGFALKGVSFTVPPGEIVAFLGENGAGKSTTLKLVMGMLREDAGTVHIGSFEHRVHEKDFKQRIGFVDEEPHFYASMSIGQLLDFAAPFYARWDERLCGDLLGQMSLSRDQIASKLSKGMKTKLALVIALAHHPDVLLLDEPSAGLDPRSRVVLFDLLRAVRAEGRGVLFSTHNVDEVEPLADRVLIIHRGAVLTDESIAKLRERAQDPSWTLERDFLELTSPDK
jgi:ABC-2 type transport system ATP-binding protein